ncbi:hypothetical protein SAMN04488028_101560 [Reichenbachiella agariperforans]|uniref:Uncharacterized protein n=1 Tax=Reichenbachiella agariperforans TaxID=156994 RepID=A0A1M6KFL6_REIAG|nr:hypothetical protein [Reichenbachiella agariperforans]SHJ57781.1 hypothetical protein SAMN04488028_101560 [Reichenbachiella agariperforans]
MKRIILIAFFGILGGATLLFASLKLYSSIHQPTSIEQQNPNEFQVTGTDSASVIFDDGTEFLTNLYELEFVAQLPTKTKIPYLILTGRQCTMCDANISIYIHSPSDGSMKQSHEQLRYGLPGELYNWEDGELIAKKRAFYGEIFPNNHGVVWYQSELDEKGNWIESTYFAGISGDTLLGSFIEANIDSTLLQVNKKLAFELPGTSQLTEP